MTFYEMIKKIHEGETRPFGRDLFYSPLHRKKIYGKVLYPAFGRRESASMILTSQDLFSSDWEVCQEEYISKETKEMMEMR